MGSERQTFIVHTERVRANALEAVRTAPPEYVVTVSPPGRSKDQNAKMWAMLNDVARAKPEGRNWVPETWKAAFMHHLGHQVMFADGLDGSGPFPVGFRTSRLTIRQMIDLIDCIYKYGDEHKVEWRETRKGGFFDEAREAA
jgi:hypothetical protein